MIKLLLIILLPLLLQGCVTQALSQPIVYVNLDRDATMQQMLSDRYECLGEVSNRIDRAGASVNNVSGAASSSSVVSCSVSAFGACLAARGWIRDYSNPIQARAFRVPSSAEVTCQQD